MHGCRARTRMITAPLSSIRASNDAAARACATAPEPSPAAPQTARPILAAALADDARHLLIAELAGEICGTADMLVVGNITHHGQPWAIVENVIVAHGSRRRGAASELMRQLVRLAREPGC